MRDASSFAATIANAHDAFDLLQSAGPASLEAVHPTTTNQAEVRERLVESLRRVISPKGLATAVSLGNDQLAELSRQSADAASQHGVPFAAEALLAAFDEGFGPNISRVFEARNSIELQAGSVFPLPGHELELLFGDRRFTPRQSSRNHIDRRRKHLDVMIPTQYRVRLDFGRPALLGAFFGSPIVAAVFPNCHPNEFVCTPDANRNRFFDLRPKNLSAQQLGVARLLERACAEHAAIAVLPELSVTPDIARTSAQHLRASGSSIVFASGSYHTDCPDAGRVNRLELHSRGAAAPALHDKFSPFLLKEWEGSSYDPPLREDIATRPTMTFHWSQGWSVITLICKDFLDDETLRLLALLRPNLVFVSAFSLETALFRGFAQEIALKSQAIVVVANFGTGEGCLGAIAAMPVKDPDDVNQPLTRTKDSSVVANKIALLDLRQPKIFWRIK